MLWRRMQPTPKCPSCGKYAGHPCSGFVAYVLRKHEIDHLDGILFIDRVHGLRRQLALRRLKRLGFEVEARRAGVTG